MPTSMMPLPKQQYFDSPNGRPLVGGKIYTYAAGTTAQKATYTDAAGTTPQANPIILNSRGEPDSPIYWDGAYKVVLKDADDNTIYTVDNYRSGIDIVALASSSGASLVGYAETTLDAILKNSVAKVVSSVSLLRAIDKTKYTQVFVAGYYAAGDGGGGQYYYDSTDTTSADNGGTIIVAADGGRWKPLCAGPISVKQFGAKGDGVTDDTAEIQAALDYVSNTTWLGSLAASYAKGGGRVYFPPGRYKVTDTLLIGANTTLEGDAPGGATAPDITTHTGAEIVWGGASGAMKWVISSATYNTSDGSFASVLKQYTGAQYDSGAMTYTHGIRIRGLAIDCGNAYGGIRLLASSDFHVENCMVWNCAVPYYFNTCYGGKYGSLRSLFGIYGALVINCTAMECGQSYHDKDSGTTWVVDNTTRMVSTYDMTASAYLPADWSNKTYGFYCSGSISMDFAAHTCEHADIGLAFAHVSDFKLTGYFEGNVESDCTFVASTGEMTVLANDTTSSHVKYHFGTVNNITLEGCSVGPIYVGETQSNKIRVFGADKAGVNTDDWTWSDVITFADVGNILRVSATGSTSAVLGYTTFDEALRRIGASAGDRRDWVVRIKDGDTVSTAAQRAVTDKSIRFEREGSGTRPTISVSAAGGGYVYRCTIDGDMSVTFRNVNVSFPTSIAGVTGDRGLFLALTNGCPNLKLTFQGGTLNLGDAYALAQVTTGGVMRVDATWSDATITSLNPGPLLATNVAGPSGLSLVTSIAASSVTCDANITALAATTNGWQGTVLNSNF